MLETGTQFVPLFAEQGGPEMLRRVVSLLALAVVALGFTPDAPAQWRSLSSQRFGGHSYVRVGDVARYYDLGRDTSPAPKRADYRTSFAQLSLQAEHREIQLNGVQHWLSAPVLDAQGKLWITSLDVLTTIDPILRQTQTRATDDARTVVLDPGHGGTDRGARGQKSREKELTLDLAKRVERELESNGVTAILTRTTDRTLSLEDRTNFAAAKRADVFVSIHLNSGGSADGIETYCLPPAGAPSTAQAFSFFRRRDDEAATGNRFDEKNIWLAHCVQRALLRATGANDRGVRRARFQVLRDASCPAILVEAGFVSNRAEEARLLNVDYRDRLAKAIAQGILLYKRGVE
jgi:N-acetylmuramoyl-L-alanine amidase